ncbi:hypothetical protein GJ744_012277 [Endocarpon pusillum]|uniref:Cytochrome P450 n=1 Tax=Endocarpon pusillum TaxID=364733 RepID=A0A8H7AJ14_9EURO|nr:hypothetical protein GJ744_012277 [Endocarpon pusillum]
MSSILYKIFFLTIFWYFYKLPYYYTVARRTGLPVFLCPVTPANPAWLVFAAILQPWLACHLPRFVYNRLRPCIYGWEFRERWAMQTELGRSFVLAAPGGVEVWTADPEAAIQILSRRKDFLQMEIAARIMSLFGHNVTSSDGDEWQRHRKIVAPVLNERIMAAVWDESRNQARQMMDAFTNKGEKERAETNVALEGLKTLAINVMVTVAYGVRTPWALAVSYEKAPPGHSISFMETMSSIVNNLIPAAFISSYVLSQPFMPAGLKKLGDAKREFPLYAHEMIAKQRESRDIQNNLIGALVRAADDSPWATKAKMYLSESEIIGNIFNITIAGFDTTANAIAYAFLAFALYPEWQEWVIEELDMLSPCSDSQKYQKHYPRLTRCMALLYETVRIYSPVLHITRRANGPQATPFLVPNGTNIFVAVGCTHVSPEIYGSDALSFRPTRWIKPSVSGEHEVLVEPIKGTFLPWGVGPRQCPGQKMAQVEFVAVVQEVLGKWRVEPAERVGETREMAKERLHGLIQDSQPQVSQQLRHPEEVLLRFVKR